jgi:hypothetical protein
VISRLDGAHHLRATPRYKLFQPTEICTEGSTRRAHLLNLSAGGALIYASDPPTLGTSLRVRCGARSLPAQVRWNDGRRFGVAFSTPLSTADVSDAIAAHDALVQRKMMASQSHADSGLAMV